MNIEPYFKPRNKETVWIVNSMWGLPSPHQYNDWAPWYEEFLKSGLIFKNSEDGEELVRLVREVVAGYHKKLLDMEEKHD